MRISPAKAHYQKACAARPSEGGGEASGRSDANAYELMLMKLAEDKRRLKDVQSMERKAEVKAELLPDYLPWIDGAIAGDSGRQDDVLMTVFVWAIDTADLDLALRISDYALRHGLIMPDQYKRGLACVLAEETADLALKAPVETLPRLLLSLIRANELTTAGDMPDEVRAKLYKAIGYAQRAAAQLPEARASLARALELDSRAGVKKDIERLDTAIKKDSPPPASAGVG